jgi:hypothetical protein
MTYSYDSLEQVLEMAAYRLPSKMLGPLISKVEEIILTREDSTALESEIFHLIQEHTKGGKFFSLKRLGSNDQKSAPKERKLFSLRQSGGESDETAVA